MKAYRSKATMPQFDISAISILADGDIPWRYFPVETDPCRFFTGLPPIYTSRPKTFLQVVPELNKHKSPLPSKQWPREKRNKSWTLYGREKKGVKIVRTEQEPVPGSFEEVLGWQRMADRPATMSAVELHMLTSINGLKQFQSFTKQPTTPRSLSCAEWGHHQLAYECILYRKQSTR